VNLPRRDFLPFYIPNISLFHCLGRSKVSVQIQGPFRNKLISYGEELLAPYPNPNIEAYPLSAVRDCFFTVFAATLHIWMPSPSSATCWHAMPSTSSIRLWNRDVETKVCKKTAERRDEIYETHSSINYSRP